MEKEKQTVQSAFYYKQSNICSKGYEIHMGRTELVGEAKPLNRLVNGKTEGVAVSDSCWGTYMHGILDNEGVVEDILAPFAEAKNSTFDYDKFKQKEFDKLADHVRKHVDMDLVYNLIKGEV